MSNDWEFSVRFFHRMRWVRDVFDPGDSTLASVIESRGAEPARILAFIDEGVARAWPGLAAKIESYVEAQGGRVQLAGAVGVVPGGERCKNDRAVYDAVCERVHDGGICRQSYVLAVGGGAVLDAVGFAAATVHRGVRLVRVPTTTLSQADSAVGVKNGINAFGKKNFLGTFAPPWAVIHDEHFLATLSDSDWRGGFSEVVKVALVKDRAFFENIARDAQRIVGRDINAARPLLQRSAQLHAEHIVAGGDAFELTQARPLDFGHWAAHKLEQMTGFRLQHGPAVAIGIALDVSYSAHIGLLDRQTAASVLEVLSDLELPVYDPAMRDTAELLTGLEEFRQHLGGDLTVTLLRGVGQPEDIHRIDRRVMAAAVESLAIRAGSRDVSAVAR